jgi:hypothetical protein
MRVCDLDHYETAKIKWEVLRALLIETLFYKTVVGGMVEAYTCEITQLH